MSLLEEKITALQEENEVLHKQIVAKNWEDAQKSRMITLLQMENAQYSREIERRNGTMVHIADTINAAFQEAEGPPSEGSESPQVSIDEVIRI